MAGCWRATPLACSAWVCCFKRAHAHTRSIPDPLRRSMNSASWRVEGDEPEALCEGLRRRRGARACTRLVHRAAHHSDGYRYFTRRSAGVRACRPPHPRVCIRVSPSVSTAWCIGAPCGKAVAFTALHTCRRAAKERDDGEDGPRRRQDPRPRHHREHGAFCQPLARRAGMGPATARNAHRRMP